MTTAFEALLARTLTYSAFADHRHLLVTDVDLDPVVQKARAALLAGHAEAVTIFNDATGERTEVDPGGDMEAIRSRLHRAAPADSEPTRSGPGRPKLGVVSREISLLPRHWAWLASQRGGASAAIRRMVEEARRADQVPEAARASLDAAYKAMTVLAGDQPGYEAALRALYAKDFARATGEIAPWPGPLRGHVGRLIETAAGFHALAAIGVSES